MRDYEEYITYWRNKFRERERMLQDLKKKAHQIAQQCARILADFYNVRKVYLIGSTTVGHIFHEHSDIDLIVEGLKPEIHFQALSALYAILPKGIEIDLIPWEDAYKSIKSRALEEGEVLYEKSLQDI